jgi:cysteine synthase A
VLDLSLLDGVETVSNEEAIEFARRLHREEGITSGISAARRPRRRCAWAFPPGEQGQDHRHRPARRRRALPVERAVPGFA